MDHIKMLGIIGLIVFMFFAMIIAIMGFYPVYNVWQQGLKGEAALARAEQDKKILVEQAKAEKESAQLRADAINILGAAAQKFPEYRQQEFIGAFAEALQNGTIDQIIYVPTEANIPMMEAGRVANQ